jgi:hypothetical protein
MQPLIMPFLWLHTYVFTYPELFLNMKITTTINCVSKGALRRTGQLSAALRQSWTAGLVSGASLLGFALWASGAPTLTVDVGGTGAAMIRPPPPLIDRSSLHSTAAQMPAPPAPALSNPVAGQTLDDLSAARERPLFSPDRRPPLAATPPAGPPPPRTAAAPAPSAPDIRLFGIVTGREVRHAVIGASGDRILRLKVGDAVGGWSVSAIERRQVTLTLGAQSVTLSLFSGTGAAPVAERVSAAENAAPPQQAPLRARARRR